jgi:beta-glucosidase
MSDWSAQHSGVASSLAGLDMSMPGDTAFNTGDSFWGANLTASVVNGTVPGWRLQEYVQNQAESSILTSLAWLLA